ncbi:hypothetical protein JW859_07480 [bacterium]|nr:hypothetical protein [bacterium]
MSLTWSIRGDSGNCLEVRVPEPVNYTPADDPYDNWLSCTVGVHVPPFTGQFPMELMPLELGELLEQLQKCLKKLAGRVEFEPMEPGLSFSLAFTERQGQAIVRGRAAPNVDGGHLSFEFATDQSFLAATADSLAEVVRCYPVSRRAGAGE